MERLRQQYHKTIAPKLAAEFAFKNVMQVPKLIKVVVNVGVGKFLKDQKLIDAVAADLAKITGQQPVRNKARKSIAGFKIREGQVVGLSVTLRGEKMYSFVDKLINVAMPRVKDFHGVSSKGFDGHGNYHLGLKEHLVFPEISTEAIDHAFSLEASIVTNAGEDRSAKALLAAYKFPFKKE